MELFRDVSIPHRYGKNVSPCVIARLYAARFPFLIGTVRTFNWRGHIDDLYGFPFLIGTVRTFTLFI